MGHLHHVPATSWKHVEVKKDNINIVSSNASRIYQRNILFCILFPEPKVYFSEVEHWKHWKSLVLQCKHVQNSFVILCNNFDESYNDRNPTEK